MATEDRKTMVDYYKERNQIVPALVACPVCSVQRPPFAIAAITDLPHIPQDFSCGNCIEDAKRALTPTVQPTLTWDDVRSFRSLLLARCDWTQTMDVAESVRIEWTPTRAILRDITDSHKDPVEAYAALKQLELDKFA